MKLNMIRKGIKDVWWRPYMVSGASFSANDIPFCPTTATEMPALILTYKEAKECFYEDDWNFDSVLGIWFRSSHAYKVLSHFAGIITPDFSLYQDFPLPLKLWNVYRMRAFGYWFGTLCGHAVINNVRWGTPETYWYCFDGIPENSVVAIGTVGGSPRKLEDRERFEEGLRELVKRLHPHTIIVYGSANYKCFKQLEEPGITILAYPSKTSRVFAGRAK